MLVNQRTSSNDSGLDIQAGNSTLIKSSFFRASKRIYVALYEERQAERMAQHALNVKHFIVPITKIFIDEQDLNIERAFAPS